MKLLMGAALVVLGLASLGCSGDDGQDGAEGPPGAKGEKGDTGAKGATGPKGEPGETGPKGDTGPQGEQGPAGIGAAGASGDGGVPSGTLNASCMKPCHTFSGIVEQWKTSRHYATYISNLGGDEVESWTGAKACGNCHASDGLELRAAGKVTYNGTTGPVDLGHGQLNYKDSGSGKFTEVLYAGQTTVAVVGCGTCHDNSPAHDPHLTGANYVPGSFPLRAPVGANDYAALEKSPTVGVSAGSSAGQFQTGNACIWCHKSRKDVTNYVLAGANSITSTTWGPHEGPAADVYSGKGGYEYPPPLVYSSGTHTNSLAKGCVSCHMPPVTENGGIGNHSFYPQLSACKNCHSTATSFDVNGGQSRVKKTLQLLRENLNTAKLLTRDGVNVLVDPELHDENFALDESLPSNKTGSMGRIDPTGPAAGALYNYFIVARASGTGVHNPTYVGQLLFDSIQALGGDTSTITRP